MTRKGISNSKLKSSSHLKLKFTVHLFLRFQTNAFRVPSFISASNFRLKIANLMRKRETFDAIFLRVAFRKYRPTVGTSSKFDFANCWLIDNPH